MINNNGQDAFYGRIGNHLLYENDIVIKDSSNTKVGSYSLFGHKYQLPVGIQYNPDAAKSYLAGNYNQWLTTEIEVYQIKL